MSGKNRKKNLRNITIGERGYKWLVQLKEDGNHLKVWGDNKNLIKEVKSIDPNVEITPKYIRDIIVEEWDEDHALDQVLNMMLKDDKETKDD